MLNTYNRLVRGRPGDLEVLTPIEGEKGDGAADGLRAIDASGPRPRRRWPLAIIAALVLAFAVGVPLRTHLARQELRYLQRQSARSGADDSERANAEQKLKAYLTVSNGRSDRATVDLALAALYQEEKARFDGLRSDLRRAVLVDSRLIAIRTDLVAALAHRAALFASVAAFYRWGVDGTPPASADNQTAADAGRLSVALAAARTHWHVMAPPSKVVAPPYHAVTSPLARLSHWLEEPTGAILIANSSNRLVRLDIDASRPTTTNVIADGSVVMRHGYLAYVAAGKAWAVAPDGSGPPRLLAPATYLLAADNRDDIWVVDNRNYAATEIDGSGRLIRGPEISFGLPQAATAGALIEVPPELAGVPQAQILIWDLATHRVQCHLTAAGSYLVTLATAGNLVAWDGGTGAVHVTDATSCAERRLVPAAIGALLRPATPLAAFSPDGRTLAVASAQADQPGDQVQVHVVDLSTGATQSVTTSFDIPLETMVWTGDSRRLFWIYGGPSAGPTLIGTWKVGDQQTRVLRTTTLKVGPPLLAVG